MTDPAVESISTYLERVKLFFVANNVEDARISAVLLSLLGGKVYGTQRNLLSPEQPAVKSYDKLKTVLKAHYEPKPIIIAKRLHFHKCNQNPTESIAEFVVELKRLAATCEFGQYLNDALRDHLSVGCYMKECRNVCCQNLILHSEELLKLLRALQPLRRTSRISEEKNYYNGKGFFCCYTKRY